jgi:phosphoglycolate phosphatase
MLSRSTALIFDLDGTITHSKPGIVGCLRKTLEAYHISLSEPLDRFVGPPVEEWAVELLPEAGEGERAEFARNYRACYDREGWKNNAVFPGMREVLVLLRQEGFLLYVCTSKQQHFAVRILTYFELADLFTGVYGDKAEYANHSKSDLLATLIRESALTKDSTWMIGDRIFDIDAAQANQIPCLAAGWGYGTAEEFTRANAVAATPLDVPRLICLYRLEARSLP